ncbi:TetR/AcrR family transcriptional regulator [Streptomyces zhaozhouensis]|nr:TetR/AcrR family transcriptional regulator [Streptomyces zhaozhouensis]
MAATAPSTPDPTGTPGASGTAGTAGTLPRTRRAILDAAIEVYARDSSASLGEIARAAQVGRSTLHRYFADRSALVHALLEDCAEATRRAVEEARLEDGPVADAFRRLVRAMFDLGYRVNFLFSEDTVTSAEWDETGWDAAHVPMALLFRRGQDEGYFDEEYEVDWFVRTLWYLISAGWEAMDEDGMPRHVALELVTRTLEGGLRPRAD